jgi:hypothetical protein
MFRPLILAIAAGLIFTVGCEKKSEDQKGAEKLGYKIPTAAPGVAKVPGAVLENIQYAMLRKEPKHLEAFFIESESKAYSWIGSTQWFYNHAGSMGLTLTTDEINALGIQELAQKGYISDRWSTRDYKKIRDEIDAGLRQDYEPGMEKVDERKLDMPRFTAQMDKKMQDTLNNQLKEALEKNSKAAFAGGLYRCFKAIPPEGWPHITAVIGPNAGGDKNLNDLTLKADDESLATVSVGTNTDGTMFICYVQFKKYPAAIAKLFGTAQEPAK